MTDVLAVSLQGMQQDMARLERISMNMANAMTPGYKREVVSALPVGVRGFADAVNSLQSASQAAAARSAVSLPGQSVLIQSDLRPGTLKATGQSLDVALAGPGYFEVAAAGGTAYTRQGGWHLDPRGRLVTAQGHAVMGQGGEIVLNHPNPVIDAAGRVFEPRADGTLNAVPVAQVKVVNFDRPGTLQRIGDGLLGTDEAPSQMVEADLQLRQGHVENSNVSATQEMVQLIQSMRHFESMQKVALGYDDMVGAAVRKLGELS